MKLSPLLHCILLLPLFITAGCSKGHDNPAPPPDKNCRIATATSKSGAVTVIYTLTYDNDGRISKISTDDLSKSRSLFNYAPGILSRDTYSDNWNGQQTGQLRAEVNSMGLPTLITEKQYDYTPIGQPLKLSVTITTTFEYNSQGELQLSTQKKVFANAPAGNSNITSSYTWANGNVVKQEDTGGQTSIFEYYTDKPTQKGDPVAFQNVMNYSVNPYKNKNLVKSLSNSTMIINVNYEYDETGKINTTSLTATSGTNSQEIRYQYSCN
ncbi:hypothetical protein ACTJJ0_15180 [Chitinophaga sp. 22321]|uniref:YD repeat-containing protein n=1 Tax=Chitinophaga hostae TaxID=2831022 RepID=A0ABS5J4C7_9BACT|nr:hypothetical protein [Chitinophaga hostae]MBS0029292.1 hypothetical protein [Chitinophaga hostae]